MATKSGYPTVNVVLPRQVAQDLIYALTQALQGGGGDGGKKTQTPGGKSPTGQTVTGKGGNVTGKNVTGKRNVTGKGATSGKRNVTGKRNVSGKQGKARTGKR